MDVKEFEDKLKNKTFSEEELRDFCWQNLDEKINENLKHIERIEDSDLNRWTRNVSDILKYKDKYYRIDWQEGLTEYQEDYYGEQPYEVKKIEKQITVTDWVLKDEI